MSPVTTGSNTDIDHIFSLSRQLTSLTVHKKFTLLELSITSLDNLHLRVDDFLMEVHGFNITYDIKPLDSPDDTESCSVFMCSFLGNCYASSDFSTYYCSCFSGHFGAQCQYGPYCDPQQGVNTCQNGGVCR